MQLFELKRHVSRRLGLLRRVAPADAGQELSLSVLLHAKDERALQEAVRSVGDPASSRYGRFLSRLEVRSLVAPGYQDLDSVVAWLSASGLTVQEPTGIRTVVKATGPAAAVSKALSAPIGRYASDSYRGTRLALEENPLVPAHMAPLIRGIAGLNELPAARRFPPRRAPARSKVRRGGPHDSRGPAGGFTPESIRRAYSVPGDSGNGLSQERVGIVQFGGGFSARDFATFCKTFGLPPGEVKVHTVAGGRNAYRKDETADLEVAMDAQWVRAMAPECPIDIYFVPNVDSGWVDVLAAVIDQPDGQRPSVLSISWGMPEDGYASSRRYDHTRQLFQQAALLGITIVAASGDAGVVDELPGEPGFDGTRHVDFPAVIPEVTGVGGTSLTPTAAGWEEAAWADREGATGGGFSRFVRVPAWQLPALARYTPAAFRGVPDVCAVAAPDPGLAAFVHGEWTAAGGTSIAAPIWAGLLAVLNAARVEVGLPRLGAMNPALYATAVGAVRPSGIRDVVKGRNDFAGVSGFAAEGGWDPATGLGSPNLLGLIRTLA